MPKYMAVFTYSNASWARMINSPGDRITVVEQVPDSISARAFTIAITKTGAFEAVEGHEVLTQQQLIEILALARDTADVYEVPGRPV